MRTASFTHQTGWLRLLAVLLLVSGLAIRAAPPTPAYAAVEAFYLRSAASEPWGNPANPNAMNQAFGAANWTQGFFETTSPATVFIPTIHFVFMDGSDMGATELEGFLSANHTAIENWVNSGGRLFLNAAPNEDNGMSFGFGGVTLNYGGPTFSGSASAINPALPIFERPLTPVGTAFTGTYFAHATVSGGGITPLINGDAGWVLAEKRWGDGLVLFGGMTSPNFHLPQPQATHLRTNILAYLKPGVTVQPVSGNTTEGGGTATFSVSLNSPPTGEVQIALTNANPAEGTIISPQPLVFAADADWYQEKLIVVRGEDDDVADGPITYGITTSNTFSPDPNYNSLVVPDLSITNLDDDTAAIVVSPTFMVIFEGDTPTFTVVLTSQPTSDVTIPLASSNASQVTVSPASLTFTPANWNTPQTATITGVDDAVAEFADFYTIFTGPVTTSDPNYAIDPLDVDVLLIDIDVAAINITPLAGATTEAGGTATFEFVLNSQPTANVEIGLASNNPSEGTVSPSSLTFTPANWNTVQTVTVTGVDDAVDDGDVGYTILTSGSSSDPFYAGINPDDLSMTNIDDDGVGVTVTPTSGLETTEAGGSDSFTVVLNSQPTADVSIPVSSGDSSEGTVSPTDLTFTPANWNTPQTVTVTGVNDNVDDGDQPYQINLGPASGGDYAGQAVSPVQVTNTDNDTAGITVTPTAGLVTTEGGGTATFSVVLTSEPIDNVTIGLSSNDTTEGAVSPTGLTFTAANWNTPQVVTVTGLDDSIDDGDIAYKIITANAISPGDPNYNGFNVADVNVSNTDNDTSSILVALPGDLVTTETGGTATFTIVLASQPSGDVLIDLSSSDLTEGTVSPTNLTFSPANWNTPQSITATGINDAVDDGDIAYNIITSVADSADPLYDGINPADAPVVNIDDDTAGFTVTPTSGLVTTEAGGTATFNVRLNSEPTANVTIPLSSGDTTEGTVAPAGLTFTPANWNTPQTVTATGVNDNVDDGDQAYQIITGPTTSSDGKYSVLNAADVSATNIDDDGAGITVTPTSGLLTTEKDAGTATFSVKLNSEPTANVVINLSTSDDTEGTVACIPSPSLTFTPANWNVAQTCTITGVDDLVDDGDIGYTIVIAEAESNDPNYNGQDPADVSVTNVDDDTAGITVTPTSGLLTTEAGGTATFSVKLTSQPIANVSFGLSSSDTTEGTVGPTSLTFTAANWNTVQTVTVTGVDDPLDDGDSAYSIITAPATSSDPNYNLRNASDVSVTNTDNDTSAITITPTNGLFTGEGGGTATFTVVLATRPSGDVSFGLSSSDTTEGTVSPAGLTFTPTNWNTAQIVTLSGVNDNVDDGNIVYNIVTTAATSSDPLYNLMNPTDVSVTNLDNDNSSVAVTPTSGLVTTEGGGTASFSVVLTSEPTDDVTVALSSSDTSEGTVSPANLTFTALNWATPRTVTISGVDDALADGNQAYSIQAAISSSDPKYGALSPITVSVTNTDNEPIVVSNGVFRFSAANYSFSEQNGEMTITVSRVNGSDGAVSVQYRTEDGSAQSGLDYSTRSGTLSWADGDDADKTFSVPILGDALAEADETVSLILSNPTGGATLGNPANAVLTILDNDSQSIVQFTSQNYTAFESFGLATITVVRSGSANLAITVGYRTEDSTATAPGDYTSTSGTLSWAAGDSSPKSFSIVIKTDQVNEGDETVALFLQNPGPGVTLGTPSSSLLIIKNSGNLANQLYLPLLR